MEYNVTRYGKNRRGHFQEYDTRERFADDMLSAINRFATRISDRLFFGKLDSEQEQEVLKEFDFYNKKRRLYGRNS